MKAMKSRKGGFTLVELLIVIMIIAILAGMMLLATGSATDGAEATKVINDLRNLKSAALLFYADTLTWPAAGQETSLDHYSDRPIVGAVPPRYQTVDISSEISDIDGISRQYIGVVLTGTNATVGVKKKLEGKAADTGLFGTLPASGAAATPNFVEASTAAYMNMR